MGATAADLIYERYADLLYRLAFTHLASAHDAEDAVADVFVKYLQSVPQFRSEEHEKAWFIRVLINQCNDMSRKKAVRIYTPLEEVADLASGTPTDSELLSAVHKLPENIRAAVLLHYFEGFSLEEAAVILQTSVAAVKMRLMRGRTMLKHHMKGENGL